MTSHAPFRVLSLCSGSTGNAQSKVRKLILDLGVAAGELVVEANCEVWPVVCMLNIFHTVAYGSNDGKFLAQGAGRGELERTRQFNSFPGAQPRIYTKDEYIYWALRNVSLIKWSRLNDIVRSREMI